MFLRVWHYRVAAANLARFREVYGAAGEWAALFRRAHGYLGTELFEAVDTPGALLTVDHWLDEAAWRAFLHDHAAAYRALDEACAALMEHEQEVCEVTAPE